MSVWGPSVKEVTWLSSRPFGVGTTREVVLLGNLRVHERFIRWDKGHGYSFAVYEASVPVFRRAAENYEVAPDGEGVVFTWTAALEPRSALSLLFKVFSSLLKAAFGRTAKDGQRHSPSTADSALRRRHRADSNGPVGRPRTSSVDALTLSILTRP